MIKRLLLLLILPIAAFCQVLPLNPTQLVAIQDTLYRADGTTCAGSITISWQTFTGTDGRLIYSGSLQTTITNGAVYVQLEPGQYVANYQVPPGCAASQENWVVPVSAVPVTLAVVRSINPPAAFVQISPNLIARAGAVLNQSLCWLGTYWGPGNCGGSGGGSSVWGSITGTLSAQLDLSAALAAKQNTITTGTTSQYFRGDLSLATFPTTWPWSSLTSVPSTFAPTAHAASHGNAGSDRVTLDYSQIITGTPTIPSASNANPVVDGTAASGSSANYARADHVHPTDTSRQAAISGAPGTWPSFAAVATTGSFNDLLNKPSTTGVPEGSNLYFTSARAVAAMAGLYQAAITGAPSVWPSFSAVAISGSYLDLSNAPTIPLAASSTPIMDGTGAAGSSNYFSRADHTHPTDTSRQATITGAPSSWPSSFTPSTHASTHAAAGSDPLSLSMSQISGALPHAQLPTLLSGDIPANAANTSGTAAGLSAAYIDWNAVSGGAHILNQPAVLTNPMSAAGDMIVGGGSGLLTRLAVPGNGTYCPSWSSGTVTWITCPGAGGGISSVGLTMPSGFTVTTSPLTTNGTLAVTFTSTTASYLPSAPTAGGVPTWRALVAADVPTLNQDTTGSAAKLNGTAFAGTSGDVVSFGATNTPADSGVVAANLVTAPSSLASYGVVYGSGGGKAVAAATADSTTTHALFATAGAPAFRALATSDLPTIPIAGGGTNATSAAAGTVPNATGTTASSWTATPTLGVAGATAGSLTIANSGSGEGSLVMTGHSSGTVTVAPQAAAGTPSLLWPTTSGTVATTGTSPVTVNATTGAVGCATCATSAASLTQHAVMVGAGSQASATISADTTTTHALFATSGDPAFRALANTDMPTSLKTRTCEIHIWGDGAAGALQTSDSETYSCYNNTGASLTITAVRCLARGGSTTTTMTPIITGGGSTSIVTGAITCGNSSFTGGTLNGTPTLSSTGTIDADITAIGTGTGVVLVVDLTL